MHGREASHPPREAVWVFGYGSLIWKVDFPTLERRTARIHGWARRFWQGSHDHRGTPEAPGRVVTLVSSPGAACRGVAYRVGPEVFAHLDHREKNGYVRTAVRLHFDDGIDEAGLVYRADPDNPAYLGPAADDAHDDALAIARHVARAHGPSGSNREYVLSLDDALRALGEHDMHVTAVARALRALPAA